MVKLWFKLLGAHDDNALSVVIEEGPTSFLEDIDVSDLLTKNLPSLFDIGGRVPSLLRLHCPKSLEKLAQNAQALNADSVEGKETTEGREETTTSCQQVGGTMVPADVNSPEQLEQFYDRLSNQTTIDEVLKALPSKRSILVLQLLDPPTNPATPHLLAFPALDASGHQQPFTPASRHSSIGEKKKVTPSSSIAAATTTTARKAPTIQPPTAASRDKIKPSTMSRESSVAGTTSTSGYKAATNVARNPSPSTRLHTSSPLRRTATSTGATSTSTIPTTATGPATKKAAPLSSAPIRAKSTGPGTRGIASKSPTSQPLDVSTSSAAAASVPQAAHTPLRLSDGSRAGVLPPLPDASPTKHIDGIMTSDSDEPKKEPASEVEAHNADTEGEEQTQHGKDDGDNMSEAPQGLPRRSSLTKDKKVSSKAATTTATSATAKRSSTLTAPTATVKPPTATVKRTSISSQHKDPEAAVQNSSVASVPTLNSSAHPTAAPTAAPTPRIHISQQHLGGVCDVFKPQWAKATCATCGHAKLAHQLKEREANKAKREQHKAGGTNEEREAASTIPDGSISEAAKPPAADSSPSPQRAPLPRVARTSTSASSAEDKRPPSVTVKPSHRASPLPARPTNTSSAPTASHPSPRGGPATGTAVRTTTSATTGRTTPQRNASPAGASPANLSLTAASPLKNSARHATPTRGTTADPKNVKSPAVPSATKPPMGKPAPSTTPRRGVSKDLPVKVPTAKSMPPQLPPSSPNITNSGPTDEEGTSSEVEGSSSHHQPAGLNDTPTSAAASGTVLFDMPSDDIHSGRASGAMASAGQPPLSARRVNSCLQRHIETRAASAMRSGTGSRTASPSLGRNRSPMRGESAPIADQATTGSETNSSASGGIVRSPERAGGDSEPQSALTPDKQVAEAAALLNIPPGLGLEEEAALADRARPLQLQPMDASIGSGGGTGSMRSDNFNLLDQPLGTPRVGMRSPSHYPSNVASPEDNRHDAVAPKVTEQPSQQPTGSTDNEARELVADFIEPEHATIEPSPQESSTEPQAASTEVPPQSALVASHASLASRNGVRHAHSISDIDSLATTQLVDKVEEEDDKTAEGDAGVKNEDSVGPAALALNIPAEGFDNDESSAHKEGAEVVSKNATPKLAAESSIAACESNIGSPLLGRTNTVDLEVLHQQELAVLDAEAHRLMSEATNMQGLRDNLAATTASHEAKSRRSSKASDVIEVEDGGEPPALPAQSQQLSKQPSEGEAMVWDREDGRAVADETKESEPLTENAPAIEPSTAAAPIGDDFASGFLQASNPPPAEPSKAAVDVFDDFFNGSAPSPVEATTTPATAPITSEVEAEHTAATNEVGEEKPLPQQQASPDMFVSKTSTEVEHMPRADGEDGEEDPFDTLYEDAADEKGPSKHIQELPSDAPPLPPLHPASPQTPLGAEAVISPTMDLPTSPASASNEGGGNSATLGRAGSGRLSRHSSSGGMGASGSGNGRNKRWGAATEHLHRIEDGTAEAGGFFSSPHPSASPNHGNDEGAQGGMYEEF